MGEGGESLSGRERRERGKREEAQKRYGGHSTCCIDVGTTCM